LGTADILKCAARGEKTGGKSSKRILVGITGGKEGKQLDRKKPGGRTLAGRGFSDR